MSARLLIDNSAWSRLASGRLSEARIDEIAGWMEGGEIGVVLPFLLEAGYSARSAADHAELVEQLLALPFMSVDERVESRSIDAQAQLARAGHHRLPPVDLLMAALAERHDCGLLHYDSDYDVILARTDLAFEGVWLAARGTL